MDTSSLLNGKQLLQSKLAYQEMKKRKKEKGHDEDAGELSKRKELPKNEAEMKSLENLVACKLNEMCNNLAAPRVVLSSEVGLAEWCIDKQLSKVIKGKKRPPWMGFNQDNQLMYTPEETLFLLESGSILVNYNQLPLSQQSAYQLILRDKFLFKCYRVYSYLTKLGYKIKPFTPDSEVNQVVSSKPDKSDQPESSYQNEPVAGSSKQQEHVIKAIDRAEKGAKLNLITMPLRREMFLQGTSFAKPSSWSEYKRINDPRSNPNEIYDSEGIVVELNDDLMSRPDIFYQLPNNSLLDPVNDLKPLIDQTKAYDIHSLHKILQEAGPQGKNLIKPVEASKLKIKYSVFLPTRKSYTDCPPDYYLIVCDEHDYPPALQDLISLKRQYSKSTFLFAVFSQVDFNIYTLEPFHCWDEIPTLWESAGLNQHKANIPDVYMKNLQ